MREYYKQANNVFDILDSRFTERIVERARPSQCLPCTNMPDLFFEIFKKCKDFCVFVYTLLGKYARYMSTHYRVGFQKETKDFHTQDVTGDILRS